MIFWKEGMKGVLCSSLAWMVCIVGIMMHEVPACAEALTEQGIETTKQSGKSTESSVSKYSFPISSGWTLQLSPAGDLYPPYIADPKRSGIGISELKVFESEIPNVGKDRRIEIRMGGNYGFVRIHPNNNPNAGFQFDFMVNFLGQFDMDKDSDNIGWDGLFGPTFSWADGKGLALKFGIFHDSAHVGDEFAENFGRKRIGYTREELFWGISQQFLEKWRCYAEAGWAFDVGDRTNPKHWRAQWGLEYQSKDSFFGGRAGWYFALDNQFTEERDWNGSIDLQAGFVVPFEDIGRNWRFGVEYYNGRSVLGEFYRYDESYLAFGMWFDL